MRTCRSQWNHLFSCSCDVSRFQFSERGLMTLIGHPRKLADVTETLQFVTFWKPRPKPYSIHSDTCLPLWYRKKNTCACVEEEHLSQKQIIAPCWQGSSAFTTLWKIIFLFHHSAGLCGILKWQKISVISSLGNLNSMQTGLQVDKRYVTRTVSWLPVLPGLYNKLIVDAPTLVSFLTTKIGRDQITRVKY